MKYFYPHNQEIRMELQDDHESDEMEMSDDERATSPLKGHSSSANSGPSGSKRARLDNDSLKVRFVTTEIELGVAELIITLYFRRRTTVSSANYKCTSTKWISSNRT